MFWIRDRDVSRWLFPASLETSEEFRISKKRPPIVRLLANKWKSKTNTGYVVLGCMSRELDAMFSRFAVLKLKFQHLISSGNANTAVSRHLLKQSNGSKRKCQRGPLCFRLSKRAECPCQLTGEGFFSVFVFVIRFVTPRFTRPKRECVCYIICFGKHRNF